MPCQRNMCPLCCRYCSAKCMEVQVPLCSQYRTYSPCSQSSFLSLEVSLASHTLRRERKGLITRQPSSCTHGRNLMWPIRSVLFVDCIRVMEYNYVTTCLADVSILLPNCYVRIPQRQLGSCSMTRPFLSLWRVWLARLTWTMELRRKAWKKNIEVACTY